MEQESCSSSLLDFAPRFARIHSPMRKWIPFALAAAVVVADWLPAQLHAVAYPVEESTAGLADRDRLPQSALPLSEWYQEKMKGTWGPRAVMYPPVTAPAGVDPVSWKRARIIAVAKQYAGLRYQHHHIPAWSPPESWTSRLGGLESPGLDCSNFAAWIYNYGLGVKFTGAIEDQASGPNAPGRRLEKGEEFAPGDLLFILQQDRTRVSHVVVYIDETHVIDSHGKGVQVRPFSGWYRSHLSHARRIIECVSPP